MNSNLTSLGKGAQKVSGAVNTTVLERKALIKNLIKKDPRAFFTVKISDADRGRLPASVQVNVEKKVTLEGTTEVLIFDDFKNPKNSRYEYYLNTSNGKIQLYPTSPLNLRSGAKVRLTGYQVDTMLAYDSNTKTLQTLTVPPLAVLGDQKILALLLDETLDPTTRPFSNAEAYELVFNDQVQNYYKEQSYDNLSLSGDVYGWFSKVPGGAFGHQEIEALITANNIDLSQYGYIVYLINSENGYGQATLGRADVNFNGISYLLGQAYVGARSTLTDSPDFKWSWFYYVLAH